MKFRLATASVSIAILAGCASVDMASQSANETAKSFEVPNGKANIYIVQTGGYSSGYNLFQAFVDGRMIGALADKTFLVSIVAPGPHTVVGVSPENQEGVSVEAKAGSNYFVGLNSRIGLMNARVTVKRLPEEEGRAAVKEANRAKGFDMVN